MSVPPFSEMRLRVPNFAPTFFQTLPFFLLRLKPTNFPLFFCQSSLSPVGISELADLLSKKEFSSDFSKEKKISFDPRGTYVRVQ